MYPILFQEYILCPLERLVGMLESDTVLEFTSDLVTFASNILLIDTQTIQGPSLLDYIYILW